MELFRRAVELDPNFSVALNNLGATYNALTEYEKAIKVLQRALRLQPDYAEAHYDLGVAYEGQRRNIPRIPSPLSSRRFAWLQISIKQPIALEWLITN